MAYVTSAAAEFSLQLWMSVTGTLSVVLAAPALFMLCLRTPALTRDMRGHLIVLQVSFTSFCLSKCLTPLIRSVRERPVFRGTSD